MLNFSTKAETLEIIRNKIDAEVLPLFYFSVAEFHKDNDQILNQIIDRFEDEFLIVRSSSLNEDSSTSSNAGHFTSLLNVKNTSKELLRSIKEVIASYDDNSGNQVLIQPMLKEIHSAGVAFTVDLDSKAPYYVINFDESGSTESITSGSCTTSQTIVHYKNSPVFPHDERFQELIKQLKELEKLFDNPALDVEFAFSKTGKLFILQVRPIVLNNDKVSSVDLDPLLYKIFRKTQKLQKHHPNLLGDTTFFGVMPDWNPAEIIGLKPKKLALTLYKELITDKIWASQRDLYGYRNLESHPLLVSYLGVPYIDVRVTFNSFIPKDLDETVANKLVNYYLERLRNNPEFHDKIEFKIVHSCYYFGLEEKLKCLEEYDISEVEIEQISNSLKSLTHKIIQPRNSLFINDLKKIETLKVRYDYILNSELALIDKIYWLTEDCKMYGTLPFAGVARAAFIGVQLLSSLVDLNVIENNEYESFMSSLNTVSKELSIDLRMLSSEFLSEEDFIDKYGHLRPGTYDITSSRYDEKFHEYFSLRMSDAGEVVSEEFFELDDSKKVRLQDLLVDNGFSISVEEFLEFIKSAIEGREYAKFVFTRSLSKILQLIEELGNRFEVGKEELAYLDFREVLKLYVELDHRFMKDILQDNIFLNKNYYEFTKAVRLPSLIIEPDDVYSFVLSEEEPNFISLSSIEAEIVLEKDINKSDLKDKIILIEAADPGYDFLFTKNIGGLITHFGGANSHMAIRCAELGLPAVIGAGKSNFDYWAKAKVLKIDCPTKKVTKVI